jgi:hypothetical protein
MESRRCLAASVAQKKRCGDVVLGKRTGAVAQREIVDPEKFKSGVSKIIDETVDCLNASTWAKENSPVPAGSR